MLQPKKRTNNKELAAKISAYQKQQAKEEKKPASPLRSTDPSLKIGVIIDVDGTLSKRGDRGIYDFPKSIDDEVMHAVKYILTLIDDANKWYNSSVGKTEIIILTGREDQYREVTNEWLNKHAIPFDHVYMRRTGDRRPAAIVKEDIWISTIRDHYNVLFAIDDTPTVIEMWRKNGLYCIVADNSRENVKST